MKTWTWISLLLLWECMKYGTEMILFCLAIIAAGYIIIYAINYKEERKIIMKQGKAMWEATSEERFGDKQGCKTEDPVETFARSLINKYYSRPAYEALKDCYDWRGEHCRRPVKAEVYEWYFENGEQNDIKKKGEQIDHTIICEIDGELYHCAVFPSETEKGSYNESTYYPPMLLMRDFYKEQEKEAKAKIYYSKKRLEDEDSYEYIFITLIENLPPCYSSSKICGEDYERIQREVKWEKRKKMELEEKQKQFEKDKKQFEEDKKQAVNIVKF